MMEEEGLKQPNIINQQVFENNKEKKTNNKTDKIWLTKVYPRLDDIHNYMALGHTKEQLAPFLGIGRTTLKRYEYKYEILKNTIKDAQKSVIDEIEGLMLKRCKGYNTTQKKITTKCNNEGNITSTIIEQTQKFIEPEWKMIQFVLIHKRSETYRSGISDEGNSNININITGV